MSGRLRLAAQALAVALVAGLFALLVWKLAADEGSVVSKELAKGNSPLAPEFSLPRLDESRDLSLSSLRGKAVVLNFWASWCGPCKDEAPLLEDASRRYRSRGLVVVGIDAHDFKGDARRFLERQGITYPTVYDGPGKTLPAYDVRGFPETFFIDRTGRLVGDRIAGPVDEEKLRRNIELALG